MVLRLAIPTISVHEATTQHETTWLLEHGVAAVGLLILNVAQRLNEVGQVVLEFRGISPESQVDRHSAIENLRAYLPASRAYTVDDVKTIIPDESEVWQILGYEDGQLLNPCLGQHCLKCEAKLLFE
eukprot:CAMPEP_0172875958 /NCGR_PEP_ID=MMETSP1075-20121228/103093_1 /TAXON_ID=2916 /ORGANISM="Ceratium fusus, Strain PA161109" /LENGTH=126 /DNA_ID=CAMNT_0013727127 /DNA_START=268 /DNA_END=648 /DNA_ORIENTATION=+